MSNINDLNYKYQIVKNNIHWDYDSKYIVFDQNIDENDILLKYSMYVLNQINNRVTNIHSYSVNEYKIPDINFDEMKKIVKEFYLSIDSNFESRIDFIFQHINVKYNTIGRSVTNNSGIDFYYSDSLGTLVALAHEVSHALAGLNDKNEIDDKNKIGSLAEIESELTEELFLNYLKDNNLKIIEPINQTIKTLDELDLKSIEFYKYNVNSKGCMHRAIQELSFKKYMKEHNFNNIDMNVINSLSNNFNMSNDEVINKIEMFLNPYYPDQNQLHIINLENYDLRNGEHLSNESRFIYAFFFVEKFKSLGLNEEEQKHFYRDYINNAKNLSFEEVLKKFNFNSLNENEITSSFISEFISCYDYLNNYSYGKMKNNEKKSFDRRSKTEEEIGITFQQKNHATAQQKKQEYLEKSKENKQLVKKDDHVSGFASLFFLALTTGFVAGIGTMIIYLMIR